MAHPAAKNGPRAVAPLRGCSFEGRKVPSLTSTSSGPSLMISSCLVEEESSIRCWGRYEHGARCTKKESKRKLLQGSEGDLRLPMKQVRVSHTRSFSTSKFLGAWMFFLLATLSCLSKGVSAAPSTTLTVSDATSCSNMQITWDTSKGTAPWTLTIAVLNHIPFIYTFPANYASGKQWTYDFDVPSFKGKNPSLIVAVSDSTGKAAASSDIISVAGGSCKSITETLDFVWYTTPETQRPASCDALDIHFQKDGNQPGPTAPISLTFIPVKDVPQTFQTADMNSAFTWINPYPAGTQFVLVVGDAGKAGTGGVGALYTSGSKANKCSNKQNQGAIAAGLAGATSTLAAGAGSSATRSKGSASQTGRASSTPNDSNASSAGSSGGNSSQGSGGGSKTGAAVGGAIGAVAAVALIGAAIWWYRRKRTQQYENDFGNVKGMSRGGSLYNSYANVGSDAAVGGAAAAGAAGAGAGYGAWAYNTRTPQEQNVESDPFSDGNGSNGFAMGGAIPLSQRAPSHTSSGSQEKLVSSQGSDSIRPNSTTTSGGANSVGHASSVGAHRHTPSAAGLPGPLTLAQRQVYSMADTVPDSNLFPPPRPMNSGPMQPPSSQGQALTTAQLARQAAPSAQYAPSPPFSAQRMQGMGAPLPPHNINMAGAGVGGGGGAYPLSGGAFPAFHPSQASGLTTKQQQQQAFTAPPQAQHLAPYNSNRQLTPVQDEYETRRSEERQSEYSVEEGEVIDMRGGPGPPSYRTGSAMSNHRNPQQNATPGFAAQLDASQRRQSSQHPSSLQPQYAIDRQNYYGGGGLEPPQHQGSQAQSPAHGSPLPLHQGPGRLQVTNASPNRLSASSDESDGTYLAYLDD